MEEKKELKDFVHGYTVIYEENVRDGVHYLRDVLDSMESRVFFDYARSHSSAPFEDRYGHNYELEYHAGEYILKKR